MRRLGLLALAFGVFAIGLSGCGGSGSSVINSGTPDTSQPETVTFTFVDNPPTTAVLQIGSGSFTPISAQNNQLVVNLPAGVSRYTLAYVCSVFPDEFIIQATKQDGTAFNASCAGLTNQDLLTGSVDASQIAGATEVDVWGKEGFSNRIPASATLSNVFMPVGVNDVAFVATATPLGSALAVKILRSQTVPGAANGGNPVVFGPADLTTSQSITVNNIPAGFSAGTNVNYHTANGVFSLGDFGGPPGGALSQYQVVPSAAAQAGDFYTFFSSAVGEAQPNFPIVSVTQQANGGPITANLPPPWLSGGPVPAAFPSFPFSYSGFTGATVNEVGLAWSPARLVNFRVIIIATGSFVAGNGHAVTVPNLASIPSFAPAPVSGTNVQWGASITNVPLSAVTISPSAAPSGSFAFVSNSGSFTAP